MTAGHGGPVVVPGGERKRGVPAATYRLQVHAGFRLEDAAEVVGYLADLGVTHAYSSPGRLKSIGSCEALNAR